MQSNPISLRESIINEEPARSGLAAQISRVESVYQSDNRLNDELHVSTVNEVLNSSFSHQSLLSHNVVNTIDQILARETSPPDR